jgi:riboflavin kinase
MVMSIGWNPYYKNEKRTAEVHLINYPEDQDFYGQQLSVVVLGYLRPEMDFTGVDDLIAAIHEDIRIALRSLERPHYLKSKYTLA